MDVLSDVLRTIRLTGAVYFDIDASSPWVGESPGTTDIATAVMPGAEHVVSFHAIMAGGCWATLGDGSAPPLRLEAGDIVVFPRGAPNVLSSSPSVRGPADMAMSRRPVDQHLPFLLVHGGGGPERTRFVCGYLGCDARPFNPLLLTLPAMICTRQPHDGSRWVTDLFRLAIAEGGSGRPGSETVVAKLSELMFVEVLRRYVESTPADARGWLSGLREPHIGKALGLLHARPAENWTLDRLARHVGLSRSVMARRFTHYVDMPPMQYLARWRMQLACRLLDHAGTSIVRTAAEVGYESEAAFNRTFKKLVGVPPGTYRRQQSPTAQ